MNVDAFLETMRRCHLDNARSTYHATTGGTRREITPLSFFVFEFFLYNSLYQVDWAVSLGDRLVRFGRDGGEEPRQRAFLEFIQSRLAEDEALFVRSFRPLADFLDREMFEVDEWPDAGPDPGRAGWSGREFLESLLALRRMVEEPFDTLETGEVVRCLDACRRYVYAVRGNIFHGRKSLAMAEEPAQDRRILAYGVFLYCYVSLFFAAAGRPVGNVGIRFGRRRGPVRAAGHREGDVRLPTASVRARNRLRRDQALLRLAGERLARPAAEPSPRAALFYPSAGLDLWTPLLLGLPYCRQFFFYERFRDIVDPDVFADLYAGHIRAVESEGWESDEYVVRFHHQGVPRVVRWVCRDNTDFLSQDVDLAFYFHRGDSLGEGGSGQRWDSLLIPALLEKIPAGSSSLFVTDGEPGGLHPHLLAALPRKEGIIKPGRSSRDYYVGVLRRGSLTTELGAPLS